MTEDTLLPGHVDRRDPTTLVFFHIPKTGGQTLASILRRQYPSDLTYETNQPNVKEGVRRFEEFSVAERARFRAVQGHLHIELADSISNPTSYFTMLREPVSRVVSHYDYIARRPNHPHYEAVKGGELDLADAISRGVFPLADNGQVRALFGLGQKAVGHGQCTPAMLEAAKRAVSERFAVAGLTERFDETVQLLAHNFGWTQLYYYRKNIRSKASAQEPLPGKTMEVIRAYNELDIQLYDFVLERHAAAVRALGPAFVRKTRRYTRANRARNTLRGWKQKLSGAQRS